MKLYIDTRDNQKTIVGLDDQRMEKSTGKDKSQQLLSLIEEMLRKDNKKINDLTEIRVEIGPGSFTGIRVGISVASALGFSLNIPVNGKNVKEDSISAKY